jgi:hypothetical protein
MKNFAAILIILSIVFTPCLAQDEAACVNETASLAANQAVMDAYQAMAQALLDDLYDNVLQFCNVFSQNCTLDVGEYTSSLKTTCEAQGGQLVERNVDGTCNGDVAGIPLTDFEIAVDGAPLCAGISCDPSAIPAEIEGGLETVAQDIVVGVNIALDGNLECDFEIGSGSTPTAPTSGAQATTVWVSAACLTLVSFIWM